jgi:hypothetical protein
MTEPVQGWIRKAGERCQEVGVTDVGRSLEKSSVLEKEHHVMMIEDVRFLVAKWNLKYPLFPLSAQEILATPITHGVRWYCAVHEEFIAGPMPFAQVAFMQEIERLADTYGRQLVGGVRRLLGEEMTGGVTFIDFHIENDVSHAALSHRLLDNVLAQRPDSFEELIRVGEKAIASYQMFLGESLALGRALVARMAQ